MPEVILQIWSTCSEKQSTSEKLQENHDTITPNKRCKLKQTKYNICPIKAKKWLKRNNTTKLGFKVFLENLEFSFPQFSASKWNKRIRSLTICPRRRGKI